jgi:hypothetical protein
MFSANENGSETLARSNPEYHMPNQRTHASYTPKSRSFADCTSTGIHWEERKLATSIWICCSDSRSVKPQLEAGNIIF